MVRRGKSTRSKPEYDVEASYTLHALDLVKGILGL